jgi:hypothetical protein
MFSDFQAADNFMGIGRLSEMVYAIYRQIRLDLPADPEVHERLKEAAETPLVHLGGSDSSAKDMSLKSMMVSHYKNVQRASNRRYFMRCHMEHFSSQMLQEAEAAFNGARGVLQVTINTFIINARAILKQRK